MVSKATFDIFQAGWSTYGHSWSHKSILICKEMIWHMINRDVLYTIAQFQRSTAVCHNALQNLCRQRQNSKQLFQLRHCTLFSLRVHTLPTVNVTWRKVMDLSTFYKFQHEKNTKHTDVRKSSSYQYLSFYLHIKQEDGVWTATARQDNLREALDDVKPASYTTVTVVKECSKQFQLSWNVHESNCPMFTPPFKQFFFSFSIFFFFTFRKLSHT